MPKQFSLVMIEKIELLSNVTRKFCGGVPMLVLEKIKKLKRKSWTLCLTKFISNLMFPKKESLHF